MDGVNSPKTPTEKTALHPCPSSPPWEAQSSQEALHPRAEGLARAALGALLAHPSRTSELVEREQQNGGNHPDTAFRSPPDLSIRAKPSSRPLSRVPMWLAPPVRPAAPSCPRAARGMRGWTPALGPRTRRTEGPGDSPISLSPRQAVSPRQSWTGEAEQASRTHLRPTYFEKLQENHQHIEPKLQGWPGGARALGPTRPRGRTVPIHPGSSVPAPSPAHSRAPGQTSRPAVSRAGAAAWSLGARVRQGAGAASVWGSRRAESAAEQVGEAKPRRAADVRPRAGTRQGPPRGGDLRTRGPGHEAGDIPPTPHPHLLGGSCSGAERERRAGAQSQQGMATAKAKIGIGRGRRSRGALTRLRRRLRKHALAGSIPAQIREPRVVLRPPRALPSASFGEPRLGLTPYSLPLLSGSPPAAAPRLGSHGVCARPSGRPGLERPT